MSLQKTKGAPVNTWSNQAILPRLPVPDLQDSCAKLLQSLAPHAETEKEFLELKKDVDEFLHSQGQILQAKLIEHDKAVGQNKPPESWIDKWWVNYAYLAYREPLPINLNVHLLVTSQYRVSRETRAGFLCATMLKYKDQLDQGTIRPQTVPRYGNLPLCMDQYRRLFSCTRIPHEGMDELVVYPQSRHLVVICNDHFYKINAYPNGQHLSEQELRVSFEWIVSEASQLEPGVPVGILTAQNRDLWAQMRLKLQNLSPINQETLEAVESSIFIISLTEDYPTDPTEAAELAMHGRTGRNKWFDKTIDISFHKNGQVGAVGDHTPGEATQSMQLFDWVLKREAQHSYRDYGQPNLTAPTEKPQKLTWVLDDELRSHIDQGFPEFKKLIDKVDLRLFKFEDFGNQWIKKICKVSPDSFVQMALQITFFRLEKRIVATYETASLRQFLNGRTETGRPVSLSSLELCKSFDSKEISDEKKIQLFKDASAHHVNYMLDCFNGKGWDRHLFGLRILAHQEAATSESFSPPKLFSNEIFRRANRFILSTSNISPGTMFCGGFGIVDPEGYGVCYLIESDFIWFHISSSHECSRTSSSQFKATLVRTLFDLKGLFQRANKL